MRFDPENVKRTVGECDFGEGWYDYDVVQVEDYDRLLGLYRQLMQGSNEGQLTEPPRNH